MGPPQRSPRFAQTSSDYFTVARPSRWPQIPNIPTQSVTKFVTKILVKKNGHGAGGCLTPKSVQQTTLGLGVAATKPALTLVILALHSAYERRAPACDAPEEAVMIRQSGLQLFVRKTCLLFCRQAGETIAVTQ